MPRLLILCEYPTVLGGERSMLATLPAVTTADFEVLVACPSRGALAGTLTERSVTHIPWETHGGNNSRRPLAELRSELSAIIQRIRPDLVHANSLSTARIAGPIVGTHSVRSIGHLRDIIKLSRNAVADLNRHDSLVAVSAATRDFHLAQGLDGSRCIVIHNGIDLTEFRPRQPTGYLHRELGLPNDIRLIAVIGQLGLRKGTDIALAAAALVAAHAPNVHWLIIGERTSAKDESKSHEARLQEMVRLPSLAGRVHFLGVRNDVASLLPECAMLVHAAHQEPLGRVLLEAAACGAAIVATNVGGTSEIFPPNSGTGILVPPNNHTAIADSVVSLMSNEMTRRSIAAAARARAEAAFDIRLASQNLIALYNQTLG